MSPATRKHIDNYRTLLLERLDEYCENRILQIEATIEDHRQRAELLKEHIMSSRQACADEFDKFAIDFLSTD